MHLDPDECASPQPTNRKDGTAEVKPIAASEFDPLVILRHASLVTQLEKRMPFKEYTVQNKRKSRVS